MTTRLHTTFCRVCEPSCGLLAEVTDQRVTRLLPDREHPVTRGFACHKGLNFVDIHHDPDRLNQPLKRVSGRQEPSRFETLSWDSAVGEVADRIRALQQQYGPGAIAGYIGNPTAFNALGSQALENFFMSLGCFRMFTSGTQDCSNKFAGSEAVFGTSTLHPVPDLEHTHYALIFGENPKVSHMSFVSIANPMEKFRAARKRGAVVKFINPRRIESVTPATGDLVAIKPDTDLYLLAALLHELDAANLFDDNIIAQHGEHIDGLRAFIKPYSAEAVAEVTGIAATDIKQMALDFGRAPAACAHMSTGVNMGRQGTLCYWLLHMLSFVTGNLDRPGGNLYSLGFYPAAKAGRLKTPNIFFNSEFGELRLIRGALPGNLLPDLITTPTNPVKALIVLAGNPLLSVGGESRLREAFGQLELIVVLDLFRNATGEMADYLLPCTDMLERSDLNICGLGMQQQPFVQFTDAVVPAQFERKEEWWILNKLQQALGLPSLFDQGGEGTLYDRMNRMLRYAELSLEDVRTAPHQTVVLPPIPTGRFYADWLQTESKKVDCCPSLFDEALQRAHIIFAELQREDSQQLKLINLRTNYMHNSWYQNMAALKRPGQQFNPLHVSPQDAQRLQLQDEQAVTVRSPWGEISAQVRIDDSLRQGTVAMSHGWGNQRTPGMAVAHQYPGTNVNELLPTGPGSYEKLSNQAFMTGIPVDVEPGLPAVALTPA